MSFRKNLGFSKFLRGSRIGVCTLHVHTCTNYNAMYHTVKLPGYADTFLQVQLNVCSLFVRLIIHRDASTHLEPNSNKLN